MNIERIARDRKPPYGFHVTKLVATKQAAKQVAIKRRKARIDKREFYITL